MSNRSIKKRLFIIMTVIGIIPFVIAVIFIGWQNVIHWEAETKIDCWNRNLSINQHLEQLLDKNLYVLRTLSIAPVVKNYIANPNSQNEATFAEGFSHINSIFQDENTLAITDAKGTQLLRTDGAPKVNISQRRHFQEAMAGREYISDSIISMSTGTSISVMVVPVFDDQHKPIGMVQRNLEMNGMQDFLRTQNTPNVDILILDREKNIVAHTDGGNLTSYVKGMNVTEGFQKIMQALEGSEGAVRLNLRGKECLVTFSHNRTTDWSIITITPYSSIWSAINLIIFRGIMLGLFLFFFVGLVAYFLSSRITHPIREISRVVTGLASGHSDIDNLTVSNDDELGRMAQAINEMRTIHQKTVETTMVDNLTGLHNLNSAETVCRRKLQEYQETTLYSGLVAVMLVDLDNFKKANAEAGHQYGNQILKEFANQLKAIFTAKDCVGRMEGDEFIIILDHQPDAETIEKKAASVNQAARELMVSGKRAGLSASIGIAIAPKNGKTYNHLFHAADLALFAAKENGRDQYKVADENHEA